MSELSPMHVIAG